MLTKRIIPCLDVKKGKVVKGVQFKNHVVMGDIVDLAKFYSDENADELVFYDITASSEKRDIDYEWINKISKEINIPFTVGGGIKNIDQIRKILNLGADKVSLNTPVLENPNLINESQAIFGSQCIVIGIDSKYSEKDQEDYVHKYTGSESTCQNAKIKTTDWIQEIIQRGAGEIVLNSMNQDGVRKGFDLRLFKKIEKICTIPLIASGGAGQENDFYEILKLPNVDGALAATVFHSKKIKIDDLKQFLKKKNINIRSF